MASWRVLPPKRSPGKGKILLDVFGQTAESPSELVAAWGWTGWKTAPDDIAALFISKARLQRERGRATGSEPRRRSYVIRFEGDVRLTLCTTIDDYFEHMYEDPEVLQRVGRPVCDAEGWTAPPWGCWPNVWRSR